MENVFLVNIGNNVLWKKSSTNNGLLYHNITIHCIEKNVQKVKRISGKICDDITFAALIRNINRK